MGAVLQEAGKQASKICSATAQPILLRSRCSSYVCCQHQKRLANVRAGQIKQSARDREEA